MNLKYIRPVPVDMTIMYLVWLKWIEWLEWDIWSVSLEWVWAKKSTRYLLMWLKFVNGMEGTNGMRGRKAMTDMTYMSLK